MMNSSDCARMPQALASHLGGQLIETHISWVILSGDDAYKIKKSLRLPFVDYSSIGARHHFCNEELRLNRRLAPSLYVEVVPITGSADAPVLGGNGPVLDYAVHMRRFSAGALFVERVVDGTLEARDVDELAGLLGSFHLHAPRASPSTGYGNPALRRRGVVDALIGIEGLLTKSESHDITSWIEAQSAQLASLWVARTEQGMVRECHGDLHLANLVRADAVLAFDCIEFDPALRWIDIMDDIAFPVMDFQAHGRRDFAYRLLNGWLDLTGDHASLPALSFAIFYRALVRAHVAALRGDAAQSRRYIDLALATLQGGQPCLIITSGLPGSGKTYQSQWLLERQGAIRLRSDVERKRLFGLGPLDDSRAHGVELYRPDVNERTYAHLVKLATDALRAGYPVILDAAFLRRSERDRACALAESEGVPFHILACEAPLPLLRERLLARKGDASEADIGVLERLAATAEPLADEERAFALESTSQPHGTQSSTGVQPDFGGES
jgi:aminoglycoside phosphotransferase family enzyme/predicted kinase